MIQVAYAIGRPGPMLLLVDTRGTGKHGADGDAKLEKVLGEMQTLTADPARLRAELRLASAAARNLGSYENRAYRLGASYASLVHAE